MRRRLVPSYANVVATLALFLAVAGATAVALPGRNTVDSGDIINQEVKTADVRNDDVRAVDVRDGDLTGGELAADSVKGFQVDELSLAQVPNADFAGNADSAQTARYALNANTVGDTDTVDGVHARSFRYRQGGAGTTTQEVLSLSGLKLTARWVGSDGNFELIATTTTNGSYIRSSNGKEDLFFDVGDTVEVQGGGDGADFLAYREGGSGDPVTATFVYDESGIVDMAGTAVGR